MAAASVEAILKQMPFEWGNHTFHSRFETNVESSDAMLFKTIALDKDVLKKPRASTKSGKPPKVKEDWTKKKRKVSYAPFIFELLQKVHPKTGLSTFAMNTVNSFVHDLFERIAAEASKVAFYNNRSCSTAREIRTAVELLLPVQLGNFAASEGTKTESKYTSSK